MSNQSNSLAHRVGRKAMRVTRAAWEKQLVNGFAIEVLNLFYKGKPVPLDMIELLRRFARTENALSARLDPVSSKGKSLRNPFLSSELANFEFGAWSLTTSTLDFLESEIRIFRPNCILEFGSGLSTVCLAQYMKEAHHRSNRVNVISIEQDALQVDKTRGLLEQLGLTDSVKLFQARLRQQVIANVLTECYDAKAITENMIGYTVDLVLIDGPGSQTSSRFATLPLALPFMTPNSNFYLDDARRDGELEIALKWKRLSGIRLDGIYLNEKGLLVGKYSG